MSASFSFLVVSLPGQPWSACWNISTRAKCRSRSARSLGNHGARVGTTRESKVSDPPVLAPWATMERVLELLRRVDPVGEIALSLPGQPWSACWNQSSRP